MVDVGIEKGLIGCVVIGVSVLVFNVYGLIVIVYDWNIKLFLRLGLFIVN